MTSFSLWSWNRSSYAAVGEFATSRHHRTRLKGHQHRSNCVMGCCSRSHGCFLSPQTPHQKMIALMGDDRMCFLLKNSSPYMCCTIVNTTRKLCSSSGRQRTTESSSDYGEKKKEAAEEGRRRRNSNVKHLQQQSHAATSISSPTPDVGPAPQHQINPPPSSQQELEDRIADFPPPSEEKVFSPPLPPPVLLFLLFTLGFFLLSWVPTYSFCFRKSKSHSWLLGFAAASLQVVVWSL